MLDTTAQLRLLIWKYYFYCKYHWILTSLQFFVPILATILAIRASKEFASDVGRNITANATVLRLQGSMLANQKYEKIYYCPVSENVISVINSIERRLTSLSGDAPNSIPLFISRANESDLVASILQEESDKVAGIVFLELTNKTLKYEIRDRNVWNMDESFVCDENPYLTTGFAALQRSIDAGFTKWLIDVHKNFTSVKRTPKEFFVKADYRPSKKTTLQTSDEQSLASLLLCFLMVLVSFFFTNPLMSNVIEEKESGVKVRLMAAGVEEKLIWFTWFAQASLIGVVTYTIIVWIFIFSFDEPNPILTIPNRDLFWVYVMLFFVCQMAFSLVFCAWFHTISNAMAWFTLVTLVVSYLTYLFHEWDELFLIQLTCFVPCAALLQGLLYPHIPVEMTFLYLVFDTLLYLLLTYYISRVRPGTYGLRKPWYFPIRVWTRADVKKELNRGEYFEAPQRNENVILEARRLTKKFGRVEAVKNLNLVANQNQILVLMGHTGAGKTTTLNILTGFIQPTRGGVYFKQKTNISRYPKEYRRHLGLCTQKNILFPYMTVLNHLILFGKLRGADEESIFEEAHEYLKLVEMEEEADDLPEMLTTGEHRILCLLIALMGKPEVLILDEPTAGVDNHTKEIIWKLLKELKNGRTIIVATDMMTEANEIGDKIAVLKYGSLVSVGSVKFLQTVGFGYQLRVLRKQVPKNLAKSKKDFSANVVNLVLRNVPGSKLESRSPLEVVLFLPQTQTDRFPALFQNLESRMVELNIAEIRINPTHVDDMFVKVGGELVYKDARDKKSFHKEMDLIGNIKPLEFRKKGLILLINQNLTLFKKRTIFIFRNFGSLFCRIFLITLLLLSLLGLIKRPELLDKIDFPVIFDLHAYPDTITLITGDEANHNNELYKQFWEILSERGQDAIRVSSGKQKQPKNVLLALDLNMESEDTSALSKTLDREVLLPDEFFSTFYNKRYFHSLPVAINTVDNILVNFYFGNMSYNIVTANNPIKKINKSEDQLVRKSSVPFSAHSWKEQKRILVIWFIVVAFSSIDLLEYAVIPSAIERIDGFKHIQFLSGVSPFVYWLNALVFDFFVCALVTGLRLYCYHQLDVFYIFTWEAFVFLLVLFFISGLIFMYNVTFIRRSKHGVYIYFFFFNVICAFVAFWYYNSESQFERGLITSTLKCWFLTILKYVILFVPPFNFSLASLKLLWSWIEKHGNDFIPLSNRTKRQDQNDNSHLIPLARIISTELKFLFADIVIYTALLYLLESGLLFRIVYLINRRKKRAQRESPPPPTRKFNIEKNTLILRERARQNIMKQERLKVEMAIKSIKAKPAVVDHPLVVKSLEKIYLHPTLPAKLDHATTLDDTYTLDHALTDVSFLVPKGECFGILGRDDAGKSTLCRILTGLTWPTYGDVWISNIHLLRRREFRSNVGYCPDTTSFLGDLTAREILNMLACLRGVKHRKSMVKNWITILDLETVRKKRSSSYSVSNQRKLCVGISMVLQAPVVVLDEVTAGLDPMARHKVYQIINHAKQAQQAIVFISHSLVQCETVCDRVMVLTEGKIKYIGAIETIRKEYAGYSLRIELQEKPQNVTDVVRKTQVDGVKKHICAKFKSNSCFLKEETSNSLLFQIKHPIPWSEAFQRLEQVKTSDKVISSYLLFDTTLDEILTLFDEDLMDEHEDHDENEDHEHPEDDEVHE